MNLFNVNSIGIIRSEQKIAVTGEEATQKGKRGYHKSSAGKEKI